mgnify:CR=1 FL=1
MIMEAQIKRLKKEKNAVILAHYYVSAEVQALADYVGDSFYLAKISKKSTADIIVFCGVSFMGESAKILNPDKKVLMPDLTADCPMAHTVKEGAIEKMRERSTGNIMDVEAIIYCERESHKGIIIGKQGSMLKRIGSTARYDMQRLLGSPIYLQIWVKVKKDWRDSDFLLKNFGYDKKNI